MKILCCSDSYPVVSTLHLNRSAKPPQAKQSTEKALLVFLAYSTVEFRKLLNVGWCLTFITSFYSFHAHPLRCVLRNFTQALRDKQLLQVLLIYVTKQFVPLHKMAVIHNARRNNKRLANDSGTEIRIRLGNNEKHKYITRIIARVTSCTLVNECFLPLLAVVQ